MTVRPRLLAAGIAVGVCVLVLGLAWGWHGSKPAVRAVSSTHDAPAAVMAAARLVPDGGLLHIGASVDLGTGIVEQLLVREGENVASGQPLAYLGSHGSMAGALAQAQAQVTVARAELDRAVSGEFEATIAARDANVETASIERQQADLNVQRATELYARKVISTSVRDERRLSAERAASALTGARRERSMAIAARADAIRSARARLAVAQAAVERAQADLDQTIVKAPRDGTILRIVAHAGERIGTDGLLQLADTRKTYAVAEIFVGDLPYVTTGMKATISGGPLRTPAEGVVERISSVAGPRRMEGIDGGSMRGERVAEVWIRLPASVQAPYDSIVRAAIHVQPGQVRPGPASRSTG